MKILNNAVLVILAVIVLLATGFAFADCPGCGAEDKASCACDHAEKAGHGETISQTTCPVMGEEIDKNVYADHKGKRVYFCCEKCVEAFQEDPDEYLNKLKAEGVILEDVPVVETACPVSGKPVNKSIFTEYRGERVYFCCNGCKSAFEGNPEKYLRKS